MATAIETRYARSGDVNIAYQVVGSGPIDVVFVMGWVSNLDQFWAEPSFARFLRRLASFSRLILFDKRGTGLSDRVPVDRLPSLEDRMDDVRAVMDAVGSRRAALVGVSEGGPMCLLFAATHPDRTSAVVVVGAYARRLITADHPTGVETADQVAQILARIPNEWGGSFGLAARAPSAMGDERFVRWWGGYLRSSASPAAALALTKMNAEIDVRETLPTIRVPVLVIHRAGDRAVPSAAGRLIARSVPAARYVEVPGDDHLPFVGDQEPILDEIERFLTGERAPHAVDRVLLTVLRADAAGASIPAAVLDAARAEVAAARGRAAVGAYTLLAAFDGPARAVRCALSIAAAARAARLPLRVGLHTGECSVVDGSVVGIAVEVAGRIAAQATPGEVIVSTTVRDLVAGSGLGFEQTRGAPTGLPAGLGLLRVTDRATVPVDQPLAPTGVAPIAPLTAREREIAALVALGMTSRQIAEELVISPATVERHVANILVKLGAHHRTQIAAWAAAEGIGSLREPPKR